MHTHFMLLILTALAGISTGMQLDSRTKQSERRLRFLRGLNHALSYNLQNEDPLDDVFAPDQARWTR